MATVSTDTNFDSLTRTANEAFTVNTGATLTINVDSRYSAGAPAAGTGVISGFVCTATTPGTVLIDGRNTWWLPFTGGANTVPGYNATIEGTAGATGIFMNVTSGLQFAPLASGAAMPSTGFMKFKSKTGNFVPGDVLKVGGVTLGTVSSAGQTGWIEVVLTEGCAINLGGNGYLLVSGAWFDLDVTNGTAGQIIQAPCYGGNNTYYPALWIEDSVGAGTYTAWPASMAGAGFCWRSAANSGLSTDLHRGKFVECMSTGRFRIGSDGVDLIGYTPISGLRTRIPNVLLMSASNPLSANTVPHATVATRPDFTTSTPGTIRIDKALSSWYFYLNGFVEVTLKNLGYFDAAYLYSIAGESYLEEVICGNYNALDTVALQIYYNFFPTTLIKCNIGRAGTIAGSDYSVLLNNCDTVTISGCKFQTRTLRTAQYAGTPFSSTAMSNANLYECEFIGGGVGLNGTNIYARNSIWCDNMFSTTRSTASPTTLYGAMLIGTGADNVIIDGYAGYTGLVNTHCNTYIVRFDGCYNSVARNIGTRLTPYDHGSVNPSAYSFFTTVIKNCKIQRCYTQNASTAFHLGANSATEVYIENCGGDYADAMTTAANVAANTHVKNLGAASWGGGTGTPGTHFHNIFVSATSGNLGVAFNEPSVDSLSYVNFIPYSTTAMTGWSRTGTLNMRERYDEITYTWPYKIIGVTGFYNSDLVLVGTNTANHTCMYAIKKAGEESYSAWKAATGANLSAETISAVSGFWLKLNIACNTSSATNALTRAYINTLTSATDQDIYYPLDSYTLSFTGLEKSSKIAIVSSGSENLLELLTSSGGVASYTYGDTDVGMYIDAAILTSGYYYQKLSEYQLTSEDVSIPISQEPDLVYSPTMASGIYFAFSGINHRIYGNSGLVSDGQFEFDIQNIYSEWIAWAMTGNNLKYLPAFDATGGDNIGGGQSVGKYVFMNNNTWKFVAPNVTPLDVIVNGSLYGANSDASLIEMIGGNTTSLQIRNSALTVGINTAGSTLTAADVWEHTIENTLTAEQIQRVLLAVAAGITSIEDLGGGTANVRFYGQDETTVRVSGYMTGSERDTMNLNGA